ncbi:MAG: hypothetical protein LBB48_09340 [Treponema sp.]|jgi:hypothetical protein|nr:hypothetical protein [Treponema sp.]
MDLTAIITGSIAIVSPFVGLPSVVLSFIYKNSRNKREKEIEKIKYQKEILELEVKKQDNQLKIFEEENKELDKIINGEQKNGA